MVPQKRWKLRYVVRARKTAHNILAAAVLPRLAPGRLIPVKEFWAKKQISLF